MFKRKRDKHYLTPFMVILISYLINEFLSGCSMFSSKDRNDELFWITDSVNLFYDLHHPIESYILTSELNEISALSYQEGGQLICVQDELGIIYRYDLSTKKVIERFKFAGPGDYEGIEVVEDFIYVLKSDGDVFEVSTLLNGERKIIKYENELSSQHDTEGLGFNPYTGRLMIACKESKGIDGKNSPGPPIYEFDLHTMELLTSPVFVIERKDLKGFFERHRDFEYEEERIQFKPSAIAFNQADGYFYILASVGKMIVVVDKVGEIMATYSISPETLIQPEGITFSPEGIMYISSEGVEAHGFILAFSPSQE